MVYTGSAWRINSRYWWGGARCWGPGRAPRALRHTRGWRSRHGSRDDGLTSTRIVDRGARADRPPCSMPGSLQPWVTDGGAGTFAPSTSTAISTRGDRWIASPRIICARGGPSFEPSQIASAIGRNGDRTMSRLPIQRLRSRTVPLRAGGWARRARLTGSTTGAVTRGAPGGVGRQTRAVSRPRASGQQTDRGGAWVPFRQS